MKKKQSLHDLAIHLCEGQLVQFCGLVLRAVDFNRDFCDACNYCEMDSICTNTEISTLCAEVDEITRTSHILKLC